MTGRTVPRFVILHVALLLCLSGTGSAFRAEELTQSLGAQDSKKAAAVTQKSDREVVNVLIEKIENGTIYTKDGKAIKMSGAKLIDNSKSKTSRVKTAELIYVGGTLATVTIK